MNNELHLNLWKAVQKYKSIEADLIDLLQRADKEQIYKNFHCRSLFQYCVQILKLSEERTYALIGVARTSVKVPELKKAMKDQKITLSKAVRILAVLDKKGGDASQKKNEDWLLKAANLSKRELEKEVAEANPRAATPEQVKYVQAERLDLRLGISEKIHSRLRRAQDVESQKKGRHASLEEVLEVALNAYLEKFDPIKKAERSVRRKEKAVQDSSTEKDSARAEQSLTKILTRSQIQNHTQKKKKAIQRNQSQNKRKAIPASTKNRLLLQSKGRCMYHRITENGLEHCSERRWLDIHHLLPVSQGGGNETSNLALVCRHHHKWVHEKIQGTDSATPSLTENH